MSKPPEDTWLYEIVAKELRAGPPQDGLWLKAMVDEGANEQKAKVLYVKWRVEQLRAAHQAREREKAERAAKAAREDNARQEQQEREWSECASGHLTVCMNCGYAGRMSRGWIPFKPAMKCPRCAAYFDWHYVPLAEIRRLQREQQGGQDGR